MTTKTQRMCRRIGHGTLFRGALIALLFLLIPCSLAAQIRISGIYDFEIKKGGKDSKPEANKVNNDYLQINVHDLQLFLDASLADDISAFAKIEASKRGGGDAVAVTLELASITFANVLGPSLNISAGKILTPFGTYTRRQLSPDNPLIGTPLFFYYATNVSSSFGYLDTYTSALAQSSYGGRLSTIYYGGYYTGVEAFGGFVEDLFFYDLAVMNAPLSAVNSGTNLDHPLSLHGRIAVHPAIWGTFGVSYCSGSFLEAHNVPTSERYKQQTTGIDVNLNYLYYELNAEYILNTYDAPYVIPNNNPPPPYTSGIGGNSLGLKSNEILIDVKIDAPFYPGLYIAGRFNAVMFGTIIDPQAGSPTMGTSKPWDHDVRRFEVAFGYKIARSVLLKLGYQWTDVDVTPRPELNVIGSQLSVSF